jgi:hypothetical protein
MLPESGCVLPKNLHPQQCSKKGGQLVKLLTRIHIAATSKTHQGLSLSPTHAPHGPATLPCLLLLLVHLLPVCQHISQDACCLVCLVLLEGTQLRPQLLQERYMGLWGQKVQAGLGSAFRGWNSGSGV